MYAVPAVQVLQLTAKLNSLGLQSQAAAQRAQHAEQQLEMAAANLSAKVDAVTEERYELQVCF